MKNLKTLLVIDDDQPLRYSIHKSLSSPSLRVIEAGTAERAMELLAQEVPDVILLDLRLHETSGLLVIQDIKHRYPNVPVIMFTAYSTTSTTIEATKFGAYDYLLKPVDLAKLHGVIQQAIETRVSDSTELVVTDTPKLLHENDVCLIGDSPAMQEIYKKIGRFAPSQSNILIVGESGTGKDLVARALHYHSQRRQGPFLAINCASLSETLLESELFGHEKGAFTGADKRRAGKFEYAHGGTIFLDEIADMLPTTQAKVLRLLQDQRFERLGGNETIETNVRVIAATNKDLPTMIEQGTFRSDLYYRLNVFTIELPALRDRKEDIPELVKFFIGNFKKEFGKDQIELDPAIFSLLSLHDWPGNMRELQSTVKHALAHADGQIIGPFQLPAFVGKNKVSKSNPDHHKSGESLIEIVRSYLLAGEKDIHDKLLSHMEKTLLPAALTHTKGHLQDTCELLGLSRNTLKAKMKQHSIVVASQFSSRNDDNDQILTSPH